MSAQNQASVTVQAAGTEVTVTAQPSDSGTSCTVTCNGQSVHLTFTGTDVMVDIASAQ